MVKKEIVVEKAEGTCAARGLPGPETVNYAGHEWQRCDDTGLYSWDEANAYCANLTLDGHSDWWLPSKSELKGLRVCSTGVYAPSYDPEKSECNEGSASPTIDTQFQCYASHYWSSTTYAGNSNQAWSIYFGRGGNVQKNTKWVNAFVRCVRGGQ
jgi:hypothetical protein